MPRSKLLSEDLQWALVIMHFDKNLSTIEISNITGIALRTIQQVFEVFRKTGDVAVQKEQNHRPQRLTADDRDVSIQEPVSSSCSRDFCLLVQVSQSQCGTHT